ncbi:hypothetical protein B0H11DRAFT_855592 [Mycena galericulata]|nr:hypothetical protein B0H11DRAFT_855592 [Mycena galericulata]
MRTWRLSQDIIRRDLSCRRRRIPVCKTAAQANAYPEPLHVVMHNADGGMGPFTLTEDNVELQFATAHVGPFLLTTLLAPKVVPRNTLRESCSSRARRTPGYPLDFGSRSTPRTALRSRRASSPPSSSPVGPRAR